MLTNNPNEVEVLMDTQREYKPGVWGIAKPEEGPLPRKWRNRIEAAWACFRGDAFAVRWFLLVLMIPIMGFTVEGCPAELLVDAWACENIEDNAERLLCLGGAAETNVELGLDGEFGAAIARSLVDESDYTFPQGVYDCANDPNCLHVYTLSSTGSSIKGCGDISIYMAGTACVKVHCFTYDFDDGLGERVSQFITHTDLPGVDGINDCAGAARAVACPVVGASGFGCP